MTKIDFQNLKSKIFEIFFPRKKILFRNFEMFDEKIFFGKVFEKSKISKILPKNIVSSKISKFRGGFEEKISNIFRSQILKIDFRHEKINIFFYDFFLFERYGCVDSISGLYAVKRCHLQKGIAGECEKLGNLSSS